jgi:hypothetical protein
MGSGIVYQTIDGAFIDFEISSKGITLKMGNYLVPYQ